MKSTHAASRPPVRRSRLVAMVVVAIASVISPSCASHKALQAYEDEVISLRDENSRLKMEKLDLERQVNTYQNEVSSLDRRLQDASTPSPTPDYPELRNQGIDVSMRGSDVVISIPAGITFDSGSADLKASGQEAVRSVARRLISEFPSAQYWIEGHTDSDQPTKSKFKSNRELSIARASSVHAFLVLSCSVPDDNCIVAGHGEYRPISENTSAAGKARNRRVEIIVHR